MRTRVDKTIANISMIESKAKTIYEQMLKFDKRSSKEYVNSLHKLYELKNRIIESYKTLYDQCEKKGMDSTKLLEFINKKYRKRNPGDNSDDISRVLNWSENLKSSESKLQSDIISQRLISDLKNQIKNLNQIGTTRDTKALLDKIAKRVELHRNRVRLAAGSIGLGVGAAVGVDQYRSEEEALANEIAEIKAETMERERIAREFEEIDNPAHQDGLTTEESEALEATNFSDDGNYWEKIDNGDGTTSYNEFKPEYEATEPATTIDPITGEPTITVDEGTGEPIGELPTQAEIDAGQLDEQTIDADAEVPETIYEVSNLDQAGNIIFTPNILELIVITAVVALLVSIAIYAAVRTAEIYGRFEIHKEEKGELLAEKSKFIKDSIIADAENLKEIAKDVKEEARNIPADAHSITLSS